MVIMTVGSGGIIFEVVDLLILHVHA